MAILRTITVFIFLLTVVVPGYAASSGNLAVSAYILSWGSCRVSSTENIAFGTLNPLSPADVQATGSVTVRCSGNPRPPSGAPPGPGGYGHMDFTVGVAQSTPSPLNLSNGSYLIPYTLDLPTSATGPRNTDIYIPITAHIQGSDYMLAPAGTYTHTVTLQIDP